MVNLGKESAIKNLWTWFTKMTPVLHQASIEAKNIKFQHGHDSQEDDTSIMRQIAEYLDD
jgi:hypothetical protein